MWVNYLLVLSVCFLPTLFFVRVKEIMTVSNYFLYLTYEHFKEPQSPFNFYWQQSHAIGGNAPSPGPRQQHDTPRTTPRSTPKQVEFDPSIGTTLQDNTLAPGAAHRPSMPIPRRSGEDASCPEYPPQPRESPDISETFDPVEILEPICPLLQGPNYQPPAQEENDGGVASEQPVTTTNTLVCLMCGAGIA